MMTSTCNRGTLLFIVKKCKSPTCAPTPAQNSDFVQEKPRQYIGYRIQNTVFKLAGGVWSLLRKKNIYNIFLLLYIIYILYIIITSYMVVEGVAEK